MRGIKVEGVILKRSDFGEADRIISVFTLQRGKIRIIAKGIRRITSRRAGNVELLNWCALYLHQGKGMPILTEATTLNSFSKIKNDLILSSYAFHIIEMVDKLTAENQESPQVYFELIEVLKRLEKNPRQILIRAFEAKILAALGFVSFSGLLKILESNNWDEIEGMKIERKQALELESVLRYDLEKVLEGTLKSRKFLRKMHG
jgi:DNA repair protein RecO (recombination protein O)